MTPAPRSRRPRRCCRAGFELYAGAPVTIHTGDDDATNLYWDRVIPVRNNTGDTVIVTDADDVEVLRAAG